MNHYKNIGLFIVLLTILRILARFFVDKNTGFINQKIFFGLVLNNSLAIAILILFFVVFSLVYYYKPNFRIPVVFIEVGIVSNLCDRIFFGGVVDYIDFWIIPIFNFADILLVLGLALIILKMILNKKSP